MITGLPKAISGLGPIYPFYKSGSSLISNVMTSFWNRGGGQPADAGNPSGGLNGTALTYPVQGALPFTSPSGEIRKYLARLRFRMQNGSNNPPQAMTLFLADRLWHNSSIDPTVTTQQNITSPTWPARDVNGATLGRGVYVGLECNSTTGNGSSIATTTLQYTNSDGVAGRTGTFVANSEAWAANAPTGSFRVFFLQAGDVGIRSVQGITLGTSYVSGTVNLVAFRWVAAALVNDEETTDDLLSLCMPRLFPGSVLYPIFLGSGSGSPSDFGGVIQLAEG